MRRTLLPMKLAAVRSWQAAVDHVAGQLHRLEDLLVAGASADIAAQTFLDLLEVSLGVAPQGRRRRHHHAGDAIAALAGTGLMEGLLDRRQVAAVGQPFDGLDLRITGLGGREKATLHQYAVDENGTGAAFAGAAPFLAAGQIEVVAEDVEKPRVGLHRAPIWTAIDDDVHLQVRH
jgi:hypothetical protein